MIALVLVLVILFTVAAVVSPAIYVQLRRKRRDQKNYERGLKMVPILIHLPPLSEDIEGSGRDDRDITDENISRAQTIYSIIASTLQKSSRARYYGQRHFAFEVIASGGIVAFYAAVPVSLVEVVEQAIRTAYPATRFEEVAEHNIFSRVGKLSGTVGGELVLKESYAYPIATFQETRRDAMLALLTSLANLENEDGAGIQILMRPAEHVWRKNALAIASKKRKGNAGSKKGTEQLAGLGRDFATAFVKPPEAKDGKSESKNELSGIDQGIVDAIEDKTRQAGYEVLIRVAASSNISQRAQSILNNITASFSLFDAPGKNGFKFVPTKNVESFTTEYILRMFPQHANKCILNATELATIFHFPEQKSTPSSQLARQGSKEVDAPRNMPEKGLLLGYNVFHGVKKPVRLSDNDRARHMYVVGQTGTGKSTYLENLALQDMLNNRGFAFVDPHGDTAERLLAMVPKERTEDVIYFSPSDSAYPLGLNLFEYQTPDQKDFIIQEVLNMLYKLYDPQHQGIMGPRYEHLFRNAALTVMADPNGGTFIDIPKLFRDPAFVKQKLQYVHDQNVVEFWEKEMPQSQRSSDFGEVVAWFVSKFGAFLSNEMMRNIIGQTHSAFDLRHIMDEGKILLVNLSKGQVGLLNMQLLGMIFVMKFQAAAMSRANIPESERRNFSLYVDEFQNFSTDSFATITSEARKYHLDLIVANQFTTQLTEEIRDAVFGNMGTIVSFRIGQVDVDSLSRYFQPTFDGSDLLRIPNHSAIIRTLVEGVPTQPFSLSTLPPLGSPNTKLAEALKQLSAAKYGRPKLAVEKEIFERLATAAPEPKRPGGESTMRPSSPEAFPVGPAVQGTSGIAPSDFDPAATPPAGKPGSFLDEWLVKRQSDGPLLRSSPFAKKEETQASEASKSRPAPALEPKKPAEENTTAPSLPEAPKPEPPKSPAPKLSGEIPLDKKTQEGDGSDTIFIDPEGNLHLKSK